MTKKIAFIARTPSKRQKTKKVRAKIVLVYCPKCRMLFYDLWKEPDFWHELNSLTYICPYCHTKLHTDLGWIPP